MLLALGRSAALLSIHRCSAAAAAAAAAAAVPSRRGAMTRAAKKARVDKQDNEKKTAAAVTRDAPSSPPSVNLGVLLPALVIRRPSATVRTPYVADVVAVPEGASAAVAAAAAAAATASASPAAGAAAPASAAAAATAAPLLLQAHTPAMDCAGLITPGRKIYVAPLGPSSTARRTSHAVILAHDTRSDLDGDAYICAHPASSERLAAAALRAGAISELGASTNVLSQQTVAAVVPAAAGGNAANGGGDAAASPSSSSTSSSSRTDFVLERADGSVALVEVKIVVCADYPSPYGRSPPLVPSVAAAAAPKKASPKKTAVLGVYSTNHATAAVAGGGGNGGGYQIRTAIFPHGHAKKDVGVVSDRAIKHVHHLEAALLAGRAIVGGRERRVSGCAVLFVVARSDCAAFRPCHEACPVFAQVLARAARRGVSVLAYDVELDLGGGGGGRQAAMTLRRSLPVLLDGMGEGEEDAALDATVARVLSFNATDPRTHYKQQDKKKKPAAAAAAAAAAGKKKAQAKKKKNKKGEDSDDDDDDDDDDEEEEYKSESEGDDDDDEDEDDDGAAKKKQKKKATATATTARRSSRG